MSQVQSLWHCVYCIQNGLLRKRLVYRASTCLSMFFACQKHGSLLMALHRCTLYLARHSWTGSSKACWVKPTPCDPDYQLARAQKMLENPAQNA